MSLLRSLTISGSELRNCVKVEVDVLGSTSLIIRTVSVDVKQHWRKKKKKKKRKKKNNKKRKKEKKKK